MVNEARRQLVITNIDELAKSRQLVISSIAQICIELDIKLKELIKEGVE